MESPAASEAATEGEVSEVTSIQDIADDALLEVLARISSTDLLVAKAVCRRWRNLIADDRLNVLRRGLGMGEECLCLFDAQVKGPIQGQIFSSTRASWRNIRALVNEGYNRSGFRVLGVGSCAYLLGGSVYSSEGKETGLVHKVDIYDAIKDSWSSGVPMLKGRSCFACGLLDDGRIIVAGGCDNYKTAEIFHSDLNEWRMLPDMPTISSTCIGQVLDGRFYVVQIANNTLPATINAYDPSSDRWLILELPDWKINGNPLVSATAWQDYGLGVAGPGQLAFVGGVAFLNRNVPFLVLDYVLAYDVASQTMKMLCGLPPFLTARTNQPIKGGRKLCECVTMGGCLSVIGGSRHVGPVAWEATRSVLMLDGELGWRRIAETPVIPNYPRCAVVNLP